MSVVTPADLPSALALIDAGPIDAEPADSGGKYLFISPGLSFSVNRDLQLYAFVQFPLYQNVNGIQLTADSGFVVGASYRF